MLPSSSKWGLAVAALVVATASHAPALQAETPAPPPPAWLHQAAANAPLGPDELSLRWVGTATWEVRTAKGAFVIDPHYSRHGLWQLLKGPLEPDLPRIRAHLPQGAQAVFVGHSHHDHLVDAPTVAKLLNVPLYGSAGTARIARDEGLPASQVHALAPHERVAIGDMVVEAVPSRHSDMITNTLVYGDLAPSAHPPMRFWDYKHDQVNLFAIHWRGRTIYHFGSADLVEANLPEHRADVVLLCLSGWKDNAGVFGRVARALAPRVVIPQHHDNFFYPLEDGFHEGPLAFVGDALARMRRDMPTSSLVPVDFYQEFRLSPRE